MVEKKKDIIDRPKNSPINELQRKIALALKWNEEIHEEEIVKIPTKMYPKYACLIKVRDLIEKTLF